MGRKKIPGLVKRQGVWHIDKRIGGRRVCQSTGTDSLEEADRFLARLIEENRQAQVYGVRPTRTFEQAAAKFVLENQHKRSISNDIGRLKLLMPWIGDTPLDRLHIGTLQPWIEHRRRACLTLNIGNRPLLQVYCQTQIVPPRTARAVSFFDSFEPFDFLCYLGCVSRRTGHPSPPPRRTQALLVSINAHMLVPALGDRTGSAHKDKQALHR
jgi:hypothetical protein